LIPYATKIVDLAKETHGEIGGIGQPEGSLTIRIPESLGVYRLPLVITEFTNRRPKVRLNFTTCSHEGLQKDLRQGTTDLAFLLAESIHSADMEVEALGFEPIVLVAHASHRLANEAIVRTRDLSGETILLSRVDCSYRPLFEKILEEESISLDSTLVFHSVETLKRCVMAGAGITVLPLVSVNEEIERGKLVRLAWHEGEFDVAVLMIWYRERWLSPSLTAFMDITRKHLAGQPS
jgi:DNA-binding transcriptional LysR family regulator